jgi:hypothetical protein
MNRVDNGPEIRLSHKSVEIVLGRLATDENLREQFRRSPTLTLRDFAMVGIELTSVEIAALECLDPTALEQFADALDPRVQKT